MISKRLFWIKKEATFFLRSSSVSFFGIFCLMLNDNTPIITCRCKMNPSNNQGNNISSQWSEWSSASASSASKRDEVFDDSQQRFHAQQGVNVAARRNNHDIFPRFADHTYRDFSTWIKDGNKIEKHKKSDRNFPARLHAMLSDENFSHIISWMPHGRAWKVINKELLVEEVIPKFFGQSKYASFTRQLSGWGLKRYVQFIIQLCNYIVKLIRGSYL